MLSWANLLPSPHPSPVNWAERPSRALSSYKISWVYEISNFPNQLDNRLMLIYNSDLFKPTKEGCKMRDIGIQWPSLKKKLIWPPNAPICWCLDQFFSSCLQGWIKPILSSSNTGSRETQCEWSADWIEKGIIVFPQSSCLLKILNKSPNISSAL